MELLNRVKNKLFSTIGGVAQGVGNFLQNDFSRNPAVQAFNNVRQAIPTLQTQVQESLPQIEEAVQQVIPPIQSTANTWWKDQISRPIAPTLDALFPGKTPTLEGVGNFARDVAQASMRDFAGINQSVLHNIDPNIPRELSTNELSPAAQILFGKDQIIRTPTASKDYLVEQGVDPNLAMGLGVAAPLLTLTDAVGAKSAVKQGGKELLKEGGETVVKNLARKAPKYTEELFQATEGALKPGNIYKPKGAVKKLFEDTFRASQGVIERSGEAGKQISRLLDAADKQKSFASGFAKNKLTAAFKGFQKDELDTFADVVQGYVKPVSERQAQAVKVWNDIAADVARQAKKSGIDMNIRENYFPHQILDLSKADKRVIAEDMVINGKAETVAEALQDLERQVGSLPRGAERRYGNLELPRETNLPYNKSPNALFNYVENAYGRIADAKYFSKNDQTLYELARAAGTQGGDANQITKYLDQILGKNQSQSKLTRTLTSLQTVTKLNPVTSAVNLTQNLSTWLRTDTGTMAKTMKNIVLNPKGAWANAMKVGEISPDMAKQLEDLAGTGNVAGKWIKLIGMQGTEKFNRVVAVNAGMEYGQKLARQAAQGSGAALRELERLGIKPNQIKNGILSDDALQTIGREVSKTTQFATGAGELPYFWRTNVGKVVTQFKSFAYKQTGFMKDEFKRGVKETSKGNLKPLINGLTVFGISAPLAGEIVNQWKALIKNKSREDTDSLTERYFSNIAAASSFGLLDSTSSLFGEYGTSGVVGTIGGVTASDALKLGTGVADTANGVANYDPELSLDENLDPKNTTKRNLLKEIPGFGQTIANTVVPNAYVDNLNIPGTDINLGVNNSLAKDDKEIYNQLKASDPQAAEQFRQENNFAEKPKENPSFFDKLKGGGKVAGSTSSSKITWKTEGGKTMTIDLNPPDNSGKIGIAAYEEGTSNASKAIQLWGSPRNQVPEKVVLDAIEKMGFTPDDVRYAYKADFKVDEKVAYVADKQLDHDELIKQLVKGRVESIGGTRFASDGVIEGLLDKDLISKDEAKYLKKIKIDKEGKLSASSLSSGSGGLSASKIRSYINSLNSIYKDPLSSGTKTKSTSTKPVPVPELKIPKIAKSSVRRRTKTSKQWFT